MGISVKNVWIKATGFYPEDSRPPQKNRVLRYLRWKPTTVRLVSVRL